MVKYTNNKMYIVENLELLSLFSKGCKRMNEKELKRLRRSDLMELLLELSKENQELREQLQQAEAKLQERRIMIDESGSLAEAVLKLNRIFEDAQAACEQYEENIRLRCEQIENEAKRKCDEMKNQGDESISD